MIKTVVGDLLDATEDIIVQQVNCRSVMGSGVAKAIYTRWPDVKTEYHKFCRRSTSPYDLLGKVQLIDVEPGKAVANVFGQLNYLDTISIFSKRLELRSMLSRKRIQRKFSKR